MTKKTFLKELKEKLNILDENEINDIINEYETIIDDKVKDGITEKEAIESFGNLDELSNEILKAYKINPKYNKEETSEDFNSFIKKSARKLSDFTKNTIEDIKNNDSNFTIETIFEIILKAIVFLFILVILKLPFEIIESLGESILEIMVYPIDKMLVFIFDLFMFVLYVLCSILIGIAFFKDNIKSSKTKDDNKNEIKKEVETKKTKKTKKSEIKEEKIIKEKKSNNTTNIFMTIAKVFVTIVFLLPLWCVVIGLSIALAIVIYYTITGINLLGIAFILIGIIVFTSFIISILNNIFTGKKNKFILNTITGLVFIVIGGFITIDEFRKYEYIDTINHEDFTKTTNYEIIEIKDTLYIKDCNKIIDETMKDNEIKIEYSYYTDMITVNINKENNRIYFNEDLKNDIPIKLYNIIINNLKNKKIYNYSNLELTKIEKTIYTNNNTKDKIVCSDIAF